MPIPTLPTNRLLSMENPEDNALIMKYILAEEFSDGEDRCYSFDSDDEFSGDDVGDGSDEEESEDEIDFHCESVISEEQDEQSMKETNLASGARLIEDSECSVLDRDGHCANGRKELDILNIGSEPNSPMYMESDDISSSFPRDANHGASVQMSKKITANLCSV